MPENIDPQEAYRIALSFLTAVRNKDQDGVVVICQNLPHPGYLGAVIGALCQMLLGALPGDVDTGLRNMALAIEEAKWPQM